MFELSWSVIEGEYSQVIFENCSNLNCQNVALDALNVMINLLYDLMIFSLCGHA